MSKVLTAKVVNKFYDIIEVSKDNVVASKHSVTLDKKERFWFVLWGFIQKDKQTLTLNIYLYSDGWVTATLNKRVMWDDDSKTYEVVEYINSVEDIKVMVNSLTEFKPKMNVSDALWI